jgi:SSS family solute:Na+ symporter
MAAKVFAGCLLASSLALIYALFSVNGLPVLWLALPSFATDLQRIPPLRLLTIIVAVAPLVVTGADYQQFVMEARNTRAAVLGCVMAAVFLFVFGFLPAAVVWAYASDPTAALPANDNQIIPFIMAGLAKKLASGYGWMMLIGLLTAALGSSAAIVRAMTSATLGAVGNTHRSDKVNLAMILLGGLIASRGQAIIDTMVALNMVYLGAIGVVFVALLMRWKISAQGAWFAMLAGFAASLMGYVCGWVGLTTRDADLLSLASGLLASLLVFGFYAMAARFTSVDLVSPVRVK